ncbi:MAG: type II toxin-antitoxin system RatA family toxin [Myxococcales bacterium]
MAEAQRSVVVAVPPEKLWSVISDYEKYPQFIPEMRAVRVLETKGNVQRVSFEIEIAVLAFKRRVHYTLEFTNTPPLRVRWRLIESDLIKGNDGGWTLEAAGEGKTRATYQIELRLGPLVPKAVSNFLAEQSLPKLLEQFKGRAESLR